MKPLVFQVSSAVLISLASASRYQLPHKAMVPFDEARKGCRTQGWKLAKLNREALETVGAARLWVQSVKVPLGEIPSKAAFYSRKSKSKKNGIICCKFTKGRKECGSKYCDHFAGVLCDTKAH